MVITDADNPANMYLHGQFGVEPHSKVQAVRGLLRSSEQQTILQEVIGMLQVSWVGCTGAKPNELCFRRVELQTV